MKRRLIDASSLMFLVKKADLETARNFLQTSAILELTFYEVGNAIWKETCLMKSLTKAESEAIRNAAPIILARAERLPNEITSFENILELSENEKLSFYDASYLSCAKDKELILVTEDKRLTDKAKKYVQVENMVSVLSAK